MHRRPPRAPAVLLSLAFLAPLPATAETAPLVAQGCLGCHGPNGAGMGPVPALAGRDAAELRALMQAFRDGTRPATIMDRIARGYTEAELAAAVDHFAGSR
jgi:cytochrome c553